jgi:cellulose synthase/poly-beta-1,6-N-acetylglucosamine synthase-like glycosyltransferase
VTTLALALLGIAAALALWSYVLYPLLIERMASRRLPVEVEAPGLLSAEIIVSAADEEEVIAERVRNLLAQEGRPRVAIGCDGCRDRTAEAARSSGGELVRVMEFPQRRGKAAVINDLVSSSSAGVIVFTDANTRFDPGAVSALLAPFADARVGAVCGRLILEPPDSDARDAETAFWDRETRLKEAEGRLGVCLGANGAIYAARRERIEALPADSSMDDFLIPARIAHGGSRVIFARDAVAREPAPADVRSEKARRFRLGVGAGQVLRRDGWLLNFGRHPDLSLAFLSRKAARWLAPVTALLGLLVALASPALRIPALVLLLLSAGVLFLPVRSRPRGIAGKLYYFCIMNLVLAGGVVAGLFGASRPAWSRTPRSRSA